MRRISVECEEGQITGMQVAWGDPLVQSVVVTAAEWAEFVNAVDEANALALALSTPRPQPKPPVRVHQRVYGSLQRQLMELMRTGPAGIKYLHANVTTTSGGPQSFINTKTSLKRLMRDGLVEHLDGSYWLTQKGVEVAANV